MSEAKAARFASIQRDYQELRRDLLRRYGSEGELFPGGGDALLRQFALLDREEHADLAHLLAAEGVEELEYRDSQAGVLVQHRLGGSWANEAQRRAVFRLQRRFELRGGFPTDATPDALAARERLRQKIADQIHAVLGDVLFARWIAGGGAGANGANGG